jgi:hypothetical protein
MSMELLGRALARMAFRTGGQLMLEMPDDLDPKVVAALVIGANQEVRADVPFCLFVREGRTELNDRCPTCDIHELAMYRQGERLAITYTSDYSAMATFASVFPLLLSRGFPHAQDGSRGAGVAGLPEFSRALGEVLHEASTTPSLSRSGLSGAVVAVMSFLSEAHGIVGNGLVTSAAEWWAHIGCWVSALQQPTNQGGPLGIQRLYGAAGLPFPEDGKEALTMSPADYVETLEARWSSPSAITAELGRLSTIEGAKEAAANFMEIDWPDLYSGASLRTNSPISRVACPSGDPNQKLSLGWSKLREDAFAKSFVDAKGKLQVLRDGVPLPTPYKGVAPILLVSTGEVQQADGVSATLGGITLVIPYRAGQLLGAIPGGLGAVAPLIEVKGMAGTKATFTATGVDIGPTGLHVSGTLHLKPKPKVPNVAAITVECNGLGTQSFADRSSCTLTVLWPGEVAIWARQLQRKSKRGSREPVVWSGKEDAISTIELTGAGTHQFMVLPGQMADSAPATVKVGELSLVQSGGALPNGFLAGEIDIKDEVAITLGDQVICQAVVSGGSSRPKSPIIAAAHGVLPDTSGGPDDGTLGFLEQLLCRVLAELDDDTALGAVLALDTRGREEFATPAKGVFCSPSIVSQLGMASPGAPTAALTRHPAYKRLRDAYRDLGLSHFLARAEAQDGTAGLTVSRIALTDVPDGKIHELREAYRQLLEESSKLAKPSDRFWARHPFSVVVLPSGIGLKPAAAVMLSPLHPIRLAWSWAVQVGLRSAFDDGATPALGISLIDGTNFPAHCYVEDAFGTLLAFQPVTVDAHPEDVYLGWQASVPIVFGKPAVPAWVAGYRFPVDGMSALSKSAVGCAIDDFLRVFPQVQVLKVGLEATMPSRRSSAVDDGLMDKVNQLAARSTKLDGVAGVQVHDSINRLGSVPRLERLSDALAVARPGFNVQWTRCQPEQDSGCHVTILEGSAAFMTTARSALLQVGWLPSLPLRRTPTRRHDGHALHIDFGMSPACQGSDTFAGVLAAYESVGDGSRFITHILPNLAGITSRPQWLVTSEFGVDPQSLSVAATTQAGSSYLLWDWRPTSATRSGSSTGRLQPYFVIAAVPQALNGAIRDRLRQLNPSLEPGEVDRRVRTLIDTLAKRAIGLNSLLSIGHHQATGALGFFFALLSLERWVRAAAPGDIRLVVPVDAVDAFLREGRSADAPDGRKRADLLVIRAGKQVDGSYQVVISPIEVKHYGLGGAVQAPAFPMAGDSRIEGHLSQLQAYQEQVVELCERHSATAGALASIMAQRLIALIDAATQLNPGAEEHTTELLASIASGMATFVPGKGVFAWYQAGASGASGAKAEWELSPGAVESSRVEVHIDPASFDAAYWRDENGDCHAVISSALDCATEVGTSAISGGHPPQAGGQQGDSSPAATGNSGTHGEPAPTTSQAAQADGNTRQDVALGQTITPSEPTVAQGMTSPTGGGPQPGGDRLDNRLARHPDSELERRYRLLIAALKEFKVQVHRPQEGTPYREGPGFIEYAVVPAYGVSVNRVEGQIDNVKLRLALPADASVSCSLHLGNVLLTVPKPDHERYFVDAEQMWQGWTPPEGTFSIPLGEDISGNIVTLDFADPNSPHLLVAGVTGSGKSEALLTILHGAAHYNRPDELQLLLVDPKQTELTSLENLPHVRGSIGYSGQDAIAVLKQVANEMDARYTQFGTAGEKVRNIQEYRERVGPMARWLVVLDEYADLISDDAERKEIESLIKRVAQKARAAGIHLILSTQKPVVEVVNTVLKANLPARIALRVNNQIESAVILAETGAEHLVGKGDAIVKIGNHKTRLQFARYSVS